MSFSELSEDVVSCVLPTFFTFEDFYNFRNVNKESYQRYLSEIALCGDDKLLSLTNLYKDKDLLDMIREKKDNITIVSDAMGGKYVWIGAEILLKVEDPVGLLNRILGDKYTTVVGI